VADNPICTPGDHLRVWRGLYYHHGIYVGDDQVVQFGGRIGRRRPTARQASWMAAFVALRMVLLFMYYRHNRRFYRDARDCQHL
jgi:lecithin:retinol acyltransferase